LRDARERFIKSVVLTLSTAGLEDDLLVRLEKAVAAHPGRCPLALRLTTPSHGDFGLVTRHRVTPTDVFLRDAEKVLGPACWELKA
jgi:hypothetical protein